MEMKDLIFEAGDFANMKFEPECFKYWKHNKRLNTIYNKHYEVDLSRCNTSAQILDWISQISHKIWCNDEMLGDLVRSLDWVLGLQSNYCSGGAEIGIQNKRLERK